MWLRRFLNLEFGAIFFATLYFYLLNYANSFRSIGQEHNVAIFQSLSYGALALVATVSFMSIWSHKQDLFRHGNAHKVVVVVALCILLFHATKNIGLVLSLPMGLMLINTRDRDIFQYIFCTSILFFLLTITMYISGFITAGDRIDTPLFESKENVRQLYSLGFNNPNVTYKFFMPILLSGLYLFGKHRRVILAFFLISALLGALTGSTAGFLIAVIACVSFVFIKHDKFKSFVRKSTPYMFGILTVLSFVIAVVFGSTGSLPNSVNDSLTGRPALWNLRIENGSYINVIGNNDEYSVDGFGNSSIGQAYYALDNTFLYIMVHYGLVIYLLYCMAYFKSTRIIKDERILLVCLSLLATLFIGERSDVFSNIYLLFAVKYMAQYYLNRRQLNA